MDTIKTYLKLINENFDNAQKGHFRVNMLMMRTNTLGLLRQLNGCLGINEGEKRGDVGLPTPSKNGILVCQFCDFQTEKGEYSMKSHVGRKHKK